MEGCAGGDTEKTPQTLTALDDVARGAGDVGENGAAGAAQRIQQVKPTQILFLTGLDHVARGAGDVGDDGAVGPAQRVQQAALAHVRPPDQRHLRRSMQQR